MKLITVHHVFETLKVLDVLSGNLLEIPLPNKHREETRHFKPITSEHFTEPLMTQESQGRVATYYQLTQH